MIKQVMLDMDGVIVDFVKGICKLHNRPNPYTDEKNLGLFDMDKIWGIPAADFWKGTEYDFWLNLEFTQDASLLLDVLDKFIGLDNVCILTSPNLSKGCVDGKRDWVSKNLPQFKKRILVGSAKEFTTSKNRLLIDDRDSNVEKYIECDGKAYLFPQPWNSANGKNWLIDLPKLLK